MAAPTLENSNAPAKLDPFEMFNDVGCANEQIAACLDLLSNELHDEMERWQDRSLRSEADDVVRAARDRLYKLWLVLEAIRRDVTVTDRLFHDAESILYEEGVQREFASRMVAA